MLLGPTDLLQYAHVAVIAAPHKIVIASYTFAAYIETSLRDAGVPAECIVRIY
jgi:hypothetical protein